MNINKYRKHYIASLFGSVYDEELDRTFPVVRNPQRYSEWESKNTTAGPPIKPDNVWVTSDHHFDHSNIMRYANRQFKSVEQMNAFMIEQHNEVVGKDDVVILGGDIAFCATNKANNFIDELNGYKILIVGNHDWERKTGKLRKYNVNEVHMSYCMNVNGSDVLITHVPFRSVEMMINEDLINLHGHIHDKSMNHSRYVNMCVEHIDYQPVLLTDLIK